MADVDHDTLARWFHVYQDAPGHLSLTAFKDGRNQSHHYPTDGVGLAAAMDTAQRLTDAGHDVYMRTTTVDPEALGPGQRGGADETVAVIGIGTDLDHQQGAHKRTDLPPTPQDALSLIDGMPEPTLIVNSGGGFYAWWLLQHPCTDLERAAPLLKRWNQHIIDRGAARGWHVDQVGDLPRILRPVGSVSYKRDTPTPVVLHTRTGTRYTLDQLEHWLNLYSPVTVDPAPQPVTPTTLGAGDDDLPGRIKRRWTVAQELEVRGVDTSRSPIRCPFPTHDDHTPSFYIYDQADGGWACFGSSCPSSGGGSVIDLVMHLDGVDVTQALSTLGGRIGETPSLPTAPHLVDVPMPAMLAAPAATPAAVEAVTDGPAALDVPTDPALLDPANPLHTAVWTEYVRIVARRQAQQMDVAQTAPEPPDFMRLDRMLARPLPPITYRVVNLWPSHGRVLLAAQFKAGKSTLIGNLVRALVDGQPFLGQYPAEPLEDGRTVALIDDELHDHTLQRWYADQQIGNTEQVHVVALRGKTSTFDILDPYVRQQWAERLRAVGAQVVVFDCLRPILDALGLSEDKDAGRFLVAFDELLDAAGITEAVVVHHMGHSDERARGDSRLRDWPDAEWKIIRDVEQGEDTPNATRFFSAYGRDVDEPERRIDFDPHTRTITLSGGDRKSEKKKGEALNVVARLQELGGQASFNQLKNALGYGVQRTGRVVGQAINEGWVAVENVGNVDLHKLTPKGERV